MKNSRKTLIGSIALVFLGSIVFFFAYFLPPYQGYGGAGMAGLLAAFLMLISFIIIGLGIVIALVTFIVIFLKSRRTLEK